MKTKVIQIFKNPRFLGLFVAIGFIATGYFGIRVCAFLDTRFPMHSQNMNFFGYFDLPAMLCGLLFFGGIVICAILALWLLIASAVFLFRRKP